MRDVRQQIDRLLDEYTDAQVAHVLNERGLRTGKQVSAKFGISRSTLGTWRTKGRIKARICNDLGEWLYWLPSATELGNTDDTQKNNSTARGAV